MIFPRDPDGRARAVIDAVLPSIDGGRFPAKHIAGQPFEVTVHAFCDGHDHCRVLLGWAADGEAALRTVEMRPLGNDVWHASFLPESIGRYRYTAFAWVDHPASWRAELARRVDRTDIVLALRSGAVLADEATGRAARMAPEDARELQVWADRLSDAARDPALEPAELRALALDPAFAALIDRHPDRRFETLAPRELVLEVDRERAAFSAWYELFPRSASAEPGRHGTFADVEARLPYIAGMGFDVLYMPPIHPIGRVRRKGRNNALETESDDVGSPWAIGAAEGGHTAILPELGTIDDFRRLVAGARSFGLEIALDIAFQCAPDHPWVREHPQWFRWRPDGSVQFAENPPKKYQDIYPFNFETEDWQELWRALADVFEYWVGEGVEIFRVDNPHTKAFAFWEWVIADIRSRHPQVLFLAEAFTRPKVMHRLAKLGYSQSYTYFTWRNTKAELTAYFTELHDGPGRDYFRPNAWPNTPDILNEHLHDAPPAVFRTRLLLAATLSGNYGIYGPAYELMERTPRDVGGEDYLDSEKYQLRHWDLDRPDSLHGFIAEVNRARRAHPALQAGAGLRFFSTDNDLLIAYGRRSAAGDDAVIVVVNLDPQFVQSGWVQVDALWLGAGDGPLIVDDLLGGASYAWSHGANFVMLEPRNQPAHLLAVRPKLPTAAPTPTLDAAA